MNNTLKNFQKFSSKRQQMNNLRPKFILSGIILSYILCSCSEVIVNFIASENLHGNGNNLQTKFFFLHPHPPPILFTFHVLTISAMTEAQKLCVTNVLMNQIIILQTVYKAFFMCHKIRENWMFVTFYTCINHVLR